MSMLASLANQSDNDWSANVIIDGPDHVNDIIKIIRTINNDRITYTELSERYNNFGHTPREIGKQMSGAKYIIMTGDDNYYTPNFVNELRIASEDNPGMVYWDMIHSHYDYSYFKCSPSYNQIDMGAFATRKDLAQQINLGEEYAADGLYVENFKNKFASEKIIKIEKVLFVHN